MKSVPRVVRKHIQVDVEGVLGDQSPGSLFALGSSKELKYVKSLIYQIKV